MASLEDVAREKAELSEEELARLQSLVAEWSLVSDLAISDLVLWLPTWNDGGFVAAAQVRPTTAPTAVPEDVVGSFARKGRRSELDRAFSTGAIIANRNPARPWLPSELEAIPVPYLGRIIAVIARHSSFAPRVTGRLEEVYLTTADDLAMMICDGVFPPEGTDSVESPRAGDGVIRLDEEGRVQFASPNAVSALHRLRLATDVLGVELGTLAITLSRKHGPVDEALALVAGGRLAGSAELENKGASVNVHGIPLRRGGRSTGALVLMRDVTELRRRERALMSKDATIREIHHRVKNNLQTVSALLRLQSRRVDSAEARQALAEAGRRVGAIAVVHETLSQAPGESVNFDEVTNRIVSLVAEVVLTDSNPTLDREGSLGVLITDQATPLAMAVSELFANALEHAHASKVVIRCARDAHTASIVIDDDGVGVTGDLNEIAGLGLEIVRSIVVDDLGGEFEVQRRPTGGTRATVRITPVVK